MAVFRSTRQALHVSFLMETLPVTQKSQMQVVIERLMREHGLVEQFDERERTIDFRGLSPMEVRGQCAMVVNASKTHLTPPQLAAVSCRYGHNRRQADGVRGLAAYASPQLATGNRLAVMALVWGLFAGKRYKHDFTVRAIASEFGLAPTTLFRDQKQIAKTQRALEAEAVNALDWYFTSTELVDDAVGEAQGS